MRILISGFEPFGGMKTNPAMELLEKAAQLNIKHAEIETVLLPVVFKKCTAPLLDRIEKFNPDVVLSFGVAVGRTAINIERVGINIQDTEGTNQGDNEGDCPVDRTIEEEGPAGLFSTISVRKIAGELKQRGIPAVVSNDAGTYICNTTLYSLLYELQVQGSSTKAGFIHIPATPDMTAAKPHVPSMSMRELERALQIIVETVVLTEDNRQF